MAVQGRLRCHKTFFVAAIDASQLRFQAAAEATVARQAPRADVVRAGSRGQGVCARLTLQIASEHIVGNGARSPLGGAPRGEEPFSRKLPASGLPWFCISQHSRTPSNHTPSAVSAMRMKQALRRIWPDRDMFRCDRLALWIPTDPAWQIATAGAQSNHRCRTNQNL